MSVSIVIPNYNGEKLLLKNLPRVLEAAEYYSQKVEVIVVDDGSKDKSSSVVLNLKSKNSNLKFIRNEKNLGFSSTINKGVDRASGDIVVLLNTDAYPKKDFLGSLVEHFKDSQVFAVGCLDKSIENGRIIERGRGVGKWEKGFLVHRRGRVDRTNTLWASGGSSAFRKLFWKKLGGFNTIYNPFYWEDIDLSYRALKSGFKVLFEQKSIVYHEHEKGAIKESYSPSQVKTIAYRNQFIFVWINVTDFDLQLIHLIFLPYYLIKALIRGDWPFLIGLLRALVLLPKVIKSSFEAQKHFKLGDREVVENFSK